MTFKSIFLLLFTLCVLTSAYLSNDIREQVIRTTREFCEETRMKAATAMLDPPKIYIVDNIVVPLYDHTGVNNVNRIFNLTYDIKFSASDICREKIGYSRYYANERARVCNIIIGELDRTIDEIQSAVTRKSHITEGEFREYVEKAVSKYSAFKMRILTI